MSFTEWWCGKVLDLYSFRAWFCVWWDDNKFSILLWPTVKQYHSGMPLTKMKANFRKQGLNLMTLTTWKILSLSALVEWFFFAFLHFLDIQTDKLHAMIWILKLIWQVVWGESSMIEAERLLLEKALDDPANQRFVLLSDRLNPICVLDAILLMLLFCDLC